MPEEDPYEPTQTQQATQSQSQSQTQEGAWDPRIWGKLVPMLADTQPLCFYRDRTTITIGRLSNNTITLNSVKISGKHCMIEWNEEHDEVHCTDLSRNGTYVSQLRFAAYFHFGSHSFAQVSGRLIGKGKTQILREGAEIVFGQNSRRPSKDDFRFIFRYTARGPPEGFHKEYDLGRELGRGSFASVFRAVRKSDGKVVAVKMIHKARLHASSPQSVEAFEREVNIMRELSHPHICKLYETFTDTYTVYLVLEYCEGGDLLDYIVSREGISEEEAKYFTYQLCEALAYVHSKSIAHRDLKPENILLTRDSPPDVKLADFGLAKALDGVTKFKVSVSPSLGLCESFIHSLLDYLWHTTLSRARGYCTRPRRFLYGHGR